VTIARTVRPIHFEDFSGIEFERLVFAYHLCDGWTDLAWFGQTGSDQGRDIIGTRPFDDQPDERTVIQCVNRGSLTQAKAEKDMAAAVNAVTGKPDAFKFVCRSSVSAQRRDEVRLAAAKLGVPKIAIWSGAEFEEHLRLRAEFLLRRLVEGVPFPDSEVELRNFVDKYQDVDDQQALAMFARAFDRPVFRTPFQQESNLHAFQQAIDDTIRCSVQASGKREKASKSTDFHRFLRPSLHKPLEHAISESGRLELSVPADWESMIR
jgi:hypothetical protein